MSLSLIGHLDRRGAVSREPSTVERGLSNGYRLRMVLDGALVGLLGGCVVTLYRVVLSQAESLMRFLTEGFFGSPLGVLAWACLLAMTLVIVGALMLWEPYTVSSGIPQTEAEVAGALDMPWHRVMLAKFVEGTLCTFAGLSLGREGPSIQLGGMAGKAVSKLLRRGRGEERVLVTCGAASGMAAAFHAPLTGVMFALEEIHKVFSAPVIIGVMMSSILSDFLASQVLGMKPTIVFTFARDLPHLHYLLVILMGVLLGILGALHNLGMFGAQNLFARIRRGGPHARLLAPFALAGVFAFTFPQILCGGDGVIEVIRDHAQVSIGFMALLLLAKYLYATICFGSGAPGGTLLPLVVMGALFGCVFGKAVAVLLGVSPVFVTNFIVLGIAGLFASVVRAPITGIVLVFELTGSLDSLLSASIVSMAAYIIADLLNVDPFYEYLLTKLMCGTGEDARASLAATEKIIHEHVVETESIADGAKVGDIAWPEKTLVVTVIRGGAELVPTGETRLHALDKLVVLMSESIEGSSERALHHICRGLPGARQEQVSTPK